MRQINVTDKNFEPQELQKEAARLGESPTMHAAPIIANSNSIKKPHSGIGHNRKKCRDQTT